jgi:hypothetical protein
MVKTPINDSESITPSPNLMKYKPTTVNDTMMATMPHEALTGEDLTAFGIFFKS